MRELSTIPKCVLMAAATLMIGFASLSNLRGQDSRLDSRAVAHGTRSMAYSALTFITWPRAALEKDDSPFVIGLLGKPTADHQELLDQYSNGKRRIHGRSVIVRQFADAKAIDDCHVLFVVRGCCPETVRAALQKVAGRSILTIGETSKFTRAGGVMSVVDRGDDSVLELSLRAADRQQLKLDTRLVNLTVLTDEPESK
jgi:YfiR/HmsC-like